MSSSRTAVAVKAATVAAVAIGSADNLQGRSSLAAFRQGEREGASTLTVVLPAATDEERAGRAHRLR